MEEANRHVQEKFLPYYIKRRLRILYGKVKLPEISCFRKFDECK